MHGMLLNMQNAFSMLTGHIFPISFSPISCNPMIHARLFCKNFAIGVLQFFQSEPYFIINPRTFVINNALKMSIQFNVNGKLQRVFYWGWIIVLTFKHRIGQ